MVLGWKQTPGSRVTHRNWLCPSAPSWSEEAPLQVPCRAIACVGMHAYDSCEASLSDTGRPGKDGCCLWLLCLSFPGQRPLPRGVPNREPGRQPLCGPLRGPDHQGASGREAWPGGDSSGSPMWTSHHMPHVLLWTQDSSCMLALNRADGLVLWGFALEGLWAFLLRHTPVYSSTDLTKGLVCLWGRK